MRDPQQTHLSVTEIALGWGYSSNSHFSRHFKKVHAVSPSLYRGAGVARMCIG
ncbi:helix-turn-helix domain-containing protein [Pseudomonas typographi]|uniref:Helix-turn-helix domain-containing protein n=1 Tax=Pseudomonas typographi TaxID=2715964 RepID=A0ABR7YZV0_9PSED|nr:helix-turn-helix domain-containing protein [Pseudomonas typographi]MBD1550574.1 helix-turn-helix domain-containing protein [Pseudomonas typographi]MBD1586841.1 helix-turn-helix domain-containing protein [Pseudomonas typographi]MBD1598735.1 helix-turn-helix domain-containing protein [Pseudomonas typographi]